MKRSTSNEKLAQKNGMYQKQKKKKKTKFVDLVHSISVEMLIVVLFFSKA